MDETYESGRIPFVGEHDDIRGMLPMEMDRIAEPVGSLHKQPRRVANNRSKKIMQRKRRSMQ